MQRNGSSGRAGGGEAAVLTDAVRRLHREFDGTVHPGVVRLVVHRSRDELDCPSAEALPELVERLARQRLQERLAGV
jgi:hypothetical protein